MAELFEEYRYIPKRRTHMWIVKGDHGAVHVHCTDRRQDRLPHEKGRADYDMIYGGIEAHYARKPHHHDFCGHHDPCWVFGDKPCWSDGSSLQFSENFQNEWGLCALDRQDHEPFFRIARDRYKVWLVDGEYADDDEQATPKDTPQ